MREHPIIFNAEMVRAVLDGRKTQTRRIMTPQPADDIHRHVFPNKDVQGWLSSLKHKHGPTTAHICPFGQPGDRLWVREAFRVHSRATDVATLVYRPSERQSWTQQTHRVPVNQCNKPVSPEKWTPSIHMPRWASRITLEITGVRVERLNSMTERDAIAEGCIGGHNSIPGYHYSATPHEHFHHVWQSIYGADSWVANPWVWVIEFKRVEGTA